MVIYSNPPTVDPELVFLDTVSTPNDDALEDPFLQMLADTSDLVPVTQYSTIFAGKELLTSSSGVLKAEFSGTMVNILLDGGASGCGGKVWPAGELLSRYMIDAKNDTESLAHQIVWEESKKRKIKIVELGSGTGLVGYLLSCQFLFCSKMMANMTLAKDLRSGMLARA